ncbi:DNA-binding MarR family transcriptional regulator [Paraburkholderia sp. MM5477-R1]
MVCLHTASLRKILISRCGPIPLVAPGAVEKKMATGFAWSVFAPSLATRVVARMLTAPPYAVKYEYNAMLCQNEIVQTKLRQIEAFRAVMQAGSTTGAAEELHTSQSNVSRLITQLEADTRLVLFERSGGRLSPKPEAKALFREVERVFVGLTRLAYAADSIRNLGSGRLRIASIPGIGMSFLPRVVQRFRRSRPDVTVWCTTGPVGISRVRRDFAPHLRGELK